MASLTGIVEPHGPPPADSDLAALKNGYIAVVPMQLDEVDIERLTGWRRRVLEPPTFRK